MMSWSTDEYMCHQPSVLTHLGRVTHICVGDLTIIGSDNGLSHGRPQAIIWTNAGILSIGPLGTNFSEILIGIQIFSFKKMRLKMASAKWRPFCIGLNVLSTEFNYLRNINVEEGYHCNHTSTSLHNRSLVNLPGDSTNGLWNLSVMKW